MTPTMLAPSRALLEAFSPVRRPALCKCTKVSQTRRKPAWQGRRDVSTAPVQRSEMEVEGAERPRWSQTPPAMTAPYPTKPKPADWKPFKCNSDPQKLDRVYNNFLGPNGSALLSEETKWLAVTHKSFDHGRRGFNERLAFLGKRIVELQTSLGLLSSPRILKSQKAKEVDPHGRQPFEHPATSNVEALLGPTKRVLMHHKQIARVAEEYSIPSVVRWQPKNVDNLLGSGCDLIYAQAIYAIIGALSMEQGAAVANRIARERVIQTASVPETGEAAIDQHRSEDA